jgi:hypothetical protein
MDLAVFIFELRFAELGASTFLGNVGGIGQLMDYSTKKYTHLNFIVDLN